MAKIHLQESSHQCTLIIIYMSESIHHWVGWGSSCSVQLGFWAIWRKITVHWLQFGLLSLQQSSQHWKAMVVACSGNFSLREYNSTEAVSVVKIRVRKSCSKAGLWHDLRSCCWLHTEWELWGNELPPLPLPARLYSLETVCEYNLQKEWHTMLHRGTFGSFYFLVKVCMGYLVLAYAFQDLVLPVCVCFLNKEQVACTWIYKCCHCWNMHVTY